MPFPDYFFSCDYDSINDSQIKGKKQLSDLSEAVKFVSKKFEKLEKDRLEKEKLINVLKKKISFLNRKMKIWELGWTGMSNIQGRTVFYCTESKKIKKYKQPSSRSYKQKIRGVSESDIDRCHRIGREDQNNTKPRVVSIKFARYNDRRKVFLNKKKLKGIGVSIMEILTPLTMEKLNSSRQEIGFHNV